MYHHIKCRKDGKQTFDAFCTKVCYAERAAVRSLALKVCFVRFNNATIANNGESYAALGVA